MQENNTRIPAASGKDIINLREILIKYIYHWKFILLSVALALLLAFIYLQVATYEYQVTSTILINDEDNDGGSTSEISAFEDLGLFEGPKTSLDTEIGILKSKSLIERVVKDLKLNITYFAEKGFGYKEVYQDERPFNINFFADGSQLKEIDTLFSISAKSVNSYDLFDSQGNYVSEGSFGEGVNSLLGDFVVTPVSIDNIEIDKKIRIKISPLEEVSIGLKKRIEVVPDNIKSNLLILRLQDPVKLRAKNFLDSLVVYYNKEAIEYKGQIAKNTGEFVDSRIDDISAELEILDQGVQSYKIRNNLNNLDSEASVVLASNAQLADRIVDLTSQIKLIDYVTDYMKSNTDDLIPANLGLLNANTSQNTLNYNNLVLERNRLLTSANGNNPVISNLNNQIISLRESIDQSLVNTKSSLKIALDEARLQEITQTSKLSANPRKEREIRDIQRQQEIYETLYLYLLQKREENIILLSVTAANAKIIDKAFGSRSPVAPRKIVVLLSSMLLGFLIPISIISLKSIFNNKVHTIEDIEDEIKVPFLGDIPSLKEKKELITFKGGNENVAESFRLLRTNVKYMLKNINKGRLDKVLEPDIGQDKVEKEQSPTLHGIGFDVENLTKNNIIFISSTTRAEGKTFVAINLATSLAMLNNKVLLVEADFRHPKVAEYLNLKQQKGLANFLTDDSIGLKAITSYHKKTNLDVVPAGTIPFNPGEVLANGRLDIFLKQCKDHYDYIIVDTSSLNTAADTLSLAHICNLFIYVIRANVMSKKMLHIPRKMYQNNRLPNMAILMNDVHYEKRGYEKEYVFGE